MTRLIDSAETLQAGLSEITGLDPVMGELVALGARPPLRKREPGFPGLVGIIVAQQLSVASAGAIRKRLESALDPLSPETLLSASDDVLRGAGLSAPKIKALRAIAAAVSDGSLPIAELGDLNGDQAHAALTNIAGIGPWTADIYLLFCLGHPDVFPAGDLALQEAARLALHLEARPDEPTMAALAQMWRPWRGIAAYLLWAYYAVAKAREGVPLPSGQESGPGDLESAAVSRGRRPARRPVLTALSAAADEPRYDDVLAHPRPGSLLLEGVLSDRPALRAAAAAALLVLSEQRPAALRDIAGPLLRIAAADGDSTVRAKLMQALAKAELDGNDSRRAVAAMLRVAEGRGRSNASLRVAALQAASDIAAATGAHAGRLSAILSELAAAGPAPLKSRARMLKRRWP